MSSGTITESEMETGKYLRPEIGRETVSNGRPANQTRPTEAATQAPATDAAGDINPRLPRKIPGGFVGLGEELDRKSRDLRNAVRLMEQLRPVLEAAEKQQAELYGLLGLVVPEVQESGRALTALIEKTKSGDVSHDLSAKFEQNLTALDSLESAAGSMAANLLSVRSAWEQYARAVVSAQKLREEMRAQS